MDFVFAKLVLESGEVFSGFVPSQQQGSFFGEVVFTTGMSGYVAALTDPSYAGQILTFTYPLIGNYGVPSPSLWESERIWANGVILSEMSSETSHWESSISFSKWLYDQQIPILLGVDTRALTKTLREKGVVRGAITTESFPVVFPIHPESFVPKVSTQQVKSYGKNKPLIILVDCGMKANILRSLQNYPISIQQVPYDYDYTNEDYQGILLSNGPGNPQECTKTISVLEKAMSSQKPIFGICLGAQLLALAAGASTYKLKFGHRGQNHPCLDILQNRCLLTAQNHGYAIEESSLKSEWEVTFRHLHDGSIEGIQHKSLPYFAVQFHPESHPGPTDASFLFDQFYNVLCK